jgi:cytidylate kinase
VNRIVTISAAYGAGGSVVAPAVADALGFPILDRAVMARAASTARAATEAAQDEERTGGFWGRALAVLAQMPNDVGPTEPVATLGGDEALRREAEARLREFVAGGEGVILGWAGALVIPDAYRVRLHGPKAARVRQAMRIEGRIGEEEARKRLDETDRVRALYWRRLYRVDWADPTRYHLVIDSTAIALEAVTELVLRGARAFWSQ